jgi:hypothetical protein
LTPPVSVRKVCEALLKQLKKIESHVRGSQACLKKNKRMKNDYLRSMAENILTLNKI